MLSAFANIFKVPDLKRKVLFTLGLLAVYRVGAFIPTPGIDGNALSQVFAEVAQRQGGNLFSIMNMFSGGAMSKMTIFALGIMPYISASIILQLLTAVIPSLEKMAKEGEAGHRKMTQYTRYGTVVLSIIQSFFIALWLESNPMFGEYQIVLFPGWFFRILTVVTLTSGTAFIMWLGEQIQEKGIGNGISLVITAGIIASLPSAMFQLFSLASPFSPEKAQLKPFTLVLLTVLFIGVVVGVILVTQGQRKIPIQYAKRVVGRRVYSGQTTYIPLRVNQAGVIAIIFAQSIILFPATLASFIPNPWVQKFAGQMSGGGIVYYIIYSLLIIFFSYFYTAITFNPVDVANNMKRYGGFVPGVRPGQPTAEYFDYILTRITLPGSIFICFIAIFPNIVSNWLKIPFLIASFFGGTGLLIIVGVMLDTLRQIESQLMTRHYDGFLNKGKIRSAR